jgi:hypothetical protein
VRVALRHMLDKQLNARLRFAGQAQRTPFGLIGIVDDNRIPKIKGNRLNHTQQIIAQRGRERELACFANGKL